MADDGLELADGEPGGAVPDDADDGAPWRGDAGADRQAGAAAHAAEPAVGEVRRPGWEAKRVVEPMLADGAVADEDGVRCGRGVGDGAGRGVRMETGSIAWLDGVDLVTSRAAGIGHRVAPRRGDVPGVCPAARRDVGQHRVGIAEQREGGGGEPGDLGRVGVDVQDPGCPSSSAVAQAGRVEARLDSDGEGDVRPGAFREPAELVERAAVAGVVVGERADRSVVDEARHAGPVGKCSDRGPCRCRRRVADEDGRPLGRAEHLQAAVDVVRRDTRRRHADQMLDGCSADRGSCEDVGRYVEQHRSLRSGAGDADGLSDDPGEAARGGHLARPLCDRCGHGDVVEADLQAIGLLRRRRRGADDVDDGCAVGAGVGNRRQHVREPWAGADGGGADRPGDPCLRFGGESGGGFVAHVDQRQPAVSTCQEDRVDLHTVDGEHCRCSRPRQRVDDDVASRQIRQRGHCRPAAASRRR